MTKHKMIRVRTETHSTLKELVTLSGTKSFDECLRHGSRALFEWAKKEHATREWIRINREEDTYSRYGATE
jgi:hypothetical protein